MTLTSEPLTNATGLTEGSRSVTPVTLPRAAHDVLIDLHEKTVDGRARVDQPIGLGFQPLDKILGGGLRPGDLMLLGGAPGAGKTTFALQAARNIAASGQATCLYLCYEHDEEYLVTRLVTLESTGSTPGLGNGDGVGYSDVRGFVAAAGADGGGLWQIFAAHPALVGALERVERYGSRLLLHRASGIRTDTEAIGAMVRELQNQVSGRLVVVVDFLQKVPSYPETEDEGQRVTRIVQALKEIALGDGIAVIAIVAADKEALDGRRLRPHHFRGSSALVYEADVILVFNTKYQIVSRTRIEFNPYKAQDLHNWIICSVEKNRSGPNLLDMQFRKRFEFACFDPEGSIVEEKLVGDRVTQ
jgi:replicative DNA helicase